MKELNNKGFKLMQKGLKDPFYSASYLMGNISPSYFRKRYVKKSKLSGVNHKYFILSFDCDTEKDIEVVKDVHQRLDYYNISPSYAVPGELLKLGKNTYRDLKDNGAEFINHGYLSHTSYIKESKSYISTLFYDELSPQEVKNDIVNGHNNFINILGEAPLGYRTPHFGTYQKSSQLKFLYSVLSELDYTFSSSTTPVKGMWNGSLIKTPSGILEIPVSGCYDYPARILDSWGFRFSPNRRLNENDYVDQFTKMISFFEEKNTNGVFNIYADPSQVYDWEVFFDCMKMTSNLKNTTFIDLINNNLL
mgnify:CR=1 FL=1